MEHILLSWLGKTDLRAISESDQVGIGPVAQAVQTGRFTRLELLCDCLDDEREAYLGWLQSQTSTRVTAHPVKLPGPTDFDAIYRHARKIAAQAAEIVNGNAERLTFHLSPGTPAMAAVWIILAKTRFPAELIESSIQHGVRTVSVPFQIAADFIPDLLRRPDAELTRLTAGLPPATPAFDAIVHRSPIMQRVVARARRVALRSIPVLIEGESGTGKELLARAVHQASPRRDRPMITVNCGAIASDLIESELFGHEKGAFTGALGNVREMLNTPRRASVWTPGPVIDADDARDALLPRPSNNDHQDPVLALDIRQGIDLNGIIDRIARHYLEQAIRVTGGNKTRAARLLGFGNPTTLNNWLKKHDVES